MKKPSYSAKPAPKLPLSYILNNDAPDLLSFYYEVLLQFGDVVQLSRFSRYFLINHPDHVKHICRIRQDNYRKEGFAYKGLDALLGRGLLTRNGDDWLKHHDIIQPFFRPKVLAETYPTMLDILARQAQRWRHYAQTRQPVNLVQEMTFLMIDFTSKIFFSQYLNESQKKMLLRYGKLGRHHLRTGSFMLPWRGIANRIRFHATQRQLHQLIEHMIQTRRQDQHPPDDLLTTLCTLRNDEFPEGLTAYSLQSEIKTLFVTGVETAAHGLSWTWFNLAQYPDACHQMQEELNAVLNDRLPTPEDLPQLTYTKMIIEETLRLYPPIWLFLRKSVEEDQLGEYLIPAGSMVLVCPFTLHRHPGYWQNPNEFDPTRFSPENVQQRPRDVYIPFSTGPRACIAGSLAMIELQLTIAYLAQQFEVELLPKQKITLDPLVTLTPKPDIWIKVKERIK